MHKNWALNSVIQQLKVIDKENVLMNLIPKSPEG